jgi:di/tricarboxylate transporter
MNPAGMLTLGITVLATILLISNLLRPDLVALLVLAVLGISGLVTPNQALAGFSGSAVITILAISIIAEGLHQTGITHWLGQQMSRFAGEGETRLLIVVMLSGAILSLFMNNIAAIAVLLPATMGLARQTHLPPSRLLMPLAFGVVAGGMGTLFTTSNIIASSALRDAGFAPFGILDFLPIGIPLILIVIAYMTLFGRRLLPDRNPAGQVTEFYRLREELLSTYSMKRSLWEIKVLPGSAMAGLSIRQGAWRTITRLNVLGIARNGNYLSAPDPETIIREGDLLLAQGEAPSRALEEYGLQLFEAAPVLSQAINGEAALSELVLPPHSKLVGRTLRDIHFREKFNLSVLALWRAGKPIHMGFASLPLKVGDGLLVQGSAANLRMLHQERNVIILKEDPDAIQKPQKARLATIIGLFTLVVAITGTVPIALVSIAGAAIMILTGCLSMDDAYQSIDWRAIFLIAGMWPLSTAIQSSGLNDQIVSGFLHIANNSSPLWLVLLLIIATMILTNIMAGQAATPIVLAPIGLAIAKATHNDPHLMLMAIALGCSLAFPTPIGHPVNVMVMGSGGYTFRDFFRVGWMLTLILIPAILIGLHFFWGLSF